MVTFDPNAGPAPTRQRPFLSRQPRRSPVAVEARTAAAVGAPGELDRAELFAEMAPLVCRLTRQFGDDREAKSDMLAELYCRFASFADSYDPARGVPLRAYLVSNLTAAAFNHARACRTRRHRELSLEECPAAFESRHAADPTPGWDHDLAVQAIRQKLPAGMARLSERQRQVVLWRYYGDLAFAEIARRLRIREATARSMLRQALRKLRAWAEESGLEG